MPDRTLTDGSPVPEDNSHLRKRLDEAGYTYTDAGAFTGDTTILQVETTDMLKLKKLVELCQKQCRAMKR